MFERRYLVKKVIREEKPITTWDDSEYSSGYGDIRTYKEEIVTDIKIIGIFTSEDVAYRVAQAESADVETIYFE